MSSYLIGDCAGKFGRGFPFQDTIDIGACSVKDIDRIGPIKVNQASLNDELPIRRNYRNVVFVSRFYNSVALINDEGVPGSDQTTARFAS